MTVEFKDEEFDPTLDAPIPRMLELILQPPAQPLLVLKENFDCDDICATNFERMKDKMPDYWSDATREIGAVAIYDIFGELDRQPIPFKSIQKLTAAECFFYTLKFFINTKIADANETVAFFEEQLLRYSVQHPPKSVEIFDIPECFVLLQLFKDLFVQHLNLLRAVTSNNFIFKLEVVDPMLFVKKAKKK